MSRHTGIGLGTKLVLSSLVLLAIPWFGYSYLQEMKQFLLQGQEKAQLMAARAAATALHNRNDLFDPSSGLPGPLHQKSAFYAYPLKPDIQIDGYTSDWLDLLEHASKHGEESTIHIDERRREVPPSFKLILGVNGEHLYGVIEVKDPKLVYRHPGYRRLDNSDHLRLALVDNQGKLRRYLMTTEGPGIVTTYEVDERWRYPLDGKPSYGIWGHWREQSGGYTVEWRMPLTMLNTEQRLRIDVADVLDDNDRRVSALIGTLPAEWSDELNHLIVRSTELEQILSGLGRSSAHIWVIDRYRRVRASIGAAGGSTTASLDESLVQEALSGESSIGYRHNSNNSEVETIITSHPIYSREQVVGAVVLEQDVDEILLLQRQTFEKIALTTLLILLLSIITLLLFSYRLTWRIKRLSREVGEVIDDKGRVLCAGVKSGHRSGDELGELSRSISSILERLHHYHRFLENIPRTLRHEINNPLNAISTSLQNLCDAQPDLTDNRYLQGAERGITRLGRIMDSLTEAASLEEALRNDKLEPLDISSLCSSYVENCRLANKQQKFTLKGGEQPCFIEGCDFRLEQILDKLIDNAADFTPEGGEIAITLSCDLEQMTMEISNEGPLLDTKLQGQLFDSMISYRSAAQQDGPHLGIGLFVARTIVEYHRGSIRIANRADEKGVAVTIKFPQIKKQTN
ncbi:hypothetical protein BOW53_12990 [Solemya pervernicosa gill symbiont]|uniref:histidine kinase n=2 Tax=Gammaproteobacteria incertae sedis TaxID=118884 RepID=A0A1T2L1V6_9GAMM|nr:ATP-binding protein [Candidatus Reidiella endopervernicosa]OOZ39088.1 hypothetical protein BOW53_12990 [Solemya pervernicosa gill symbiont]QKQ27189.1 hypothetical protein HUE57_13485 [Candidatus Reidiella endopervernicosa]